MPTSQRRRGRPRGKTEKPHPIDIHVGKRVRERRNELGTGQEGLAAELGITFQQVQKYENAANRISASRLFHIAKILHLTPSYFFDGYGVAGAGRGGAAPPPEASDADLLHRPEAMELVRAFWSIEDSALRDNLVRLARSLAAGGTLK
jgi:transcriptional regulator with XRE-family HTH domain